MKKLSILLSAFLILLSICAFMAMPAKAGTASISLSENSGYPDDSVIVSANSGSGFTITSIITIKFDSITLTTTPSQVTTNVLGAFNANITIPVSTIGSHTINVTDANNNIGVATFTVLAPLTVSVSPASWIMDVGQSKSFSASASGGSGIYSTYHWYVNGSVQSSQATSTFNFVPVSVGSYSINATVTDSLGTTSAQSTAFVTVSAVPTVSVAPVGPLKMDVGQVQAFTATSAGGSGTIHYQWYVGAGLVGTDSSSYSYTASGSSASITCKVTDSASPPITSLVSNSVSITVSAVPIVSVSPASWIMDVGQAKTFNATAFGGTGTLSYQWYLGGSAVSGQTGLTYAFTASSAGSPTIYCKVTDQASTPMVVQSNSPSVTVNAVLTVSVSPASRIMDVGQSMSFSASASGGSGGYSYHWYVNGLVQVGQATSSFNFVPASIGSFSINVTVTDSLGTTSAQATSSVTVNDVPTVSILPVGTLTKNVGQIQTFTAAKSGGSGTIHYQWYVDSSTVGTDSANYSYIVPSTSHSITCRITDSASVPVTSPASNAVVITANPSLIAPTISASLSTINQGQTSILTSTSVSTGTPPYLFQWFQRVPGGNYAAVGSNSASFSFITSGATAAGSWSFIVQVTDTAGAAVNSSAVSVAVNVAPLDHFIFSSVGVQSAGTPFSITITAKNAFNSTLTNYTGTNILNVSTGTVSPAITGVFSNGVWTGSVTVTSAGSGIWLITSGSGMLGASETFTINPSALDHFTFDDISGQTAGIAFNITVTARDLYNNTVTNYVGTPSLTYSAGTISPTIMNPFVNGIGLTPVTVNVQVSSATITVVDNSRAGISNMFAVSPTPTPSPTPSPLPTTSPTAKPSSQVTPGPSITPSPTPTQLKTNLIATTESGATFLIELEGNITKSQISDALITTNNSATTTLSFNLTGENGNSGYCNMTITKTAIPYGATPVLFVDGLRAMNQGFTQDANNYYVWYTTEFSMHEMKIQFIESSTSQVISFGPVFAIGIIIPEIILIYAVIAVRRLRRRPENA